MCFCGNMLACKFGVICYGNRGIGIKENIKNTVNNRTGVIYIHAFSGYILQYPSRMVQLFMWYAGSYAVWFAAVVYCL